MTLPPATSALDAVTSIPGSITEDAVTSVSDSSALGRFISLCPFLVRQHRIKEHAIDLLHIRTLPESPALPILGGLRLISAAI